VTFSEDYGGTPQERGCPLEVRIDMKATGGQRSRTRYKLQKKKRNRGKVNINKIIKEFKIGDKVRILQEPAVQRGMPHPRFKNRTGLITKKQGSAYVVEIKDLNKKKLLVSTSIHIQKV